MIHLGVASLAAAALVFCGCSPIPRAGSAESVEPGSLTPAQYRDLGARLKADPAMATFVEDSARRRVQILVATPNTQRVHENALERWSFRADAEYFYPASAVKLCAAVAAIEKLEELRAIRPDLQLTTPLHVAFTDDRARGFDTTLQDEIEKAIVVSDNGAFNRLFDFVGREELAGRLAALGVSSARITHHLGDVDSAVAAFDFRGEGRPLSVAQRIDIELAPPRSAFVGAAYVDGDGHLVDAPLDFAEKNRIALRDLQDLLVATVRPDVSELTPPRWSTSDREALVSILGRLPSEWPDHDVPRSLDDVHKPLAAAVKSALPGHAITVYGKGGRAYGFTVENAYVVDATTNRSVFVAATIYANDNETLNDDRYEYQTVADLFIMELGRFVARAFLR